ncbi:glycosyltransferase [Neiella marina]|uniref:Glycosyltransferase n=1 Tax=Neiella holothuriorum TaxID=2870530 RepID=A0ABS7EGY9_9GAMM|nr:glycosyltransferase [Neiella holothuriorum]
MDVSFIIPHKGREEMLLKTLRSIQGLHYDLARVEILLISQNEGNSRELDELVNELSVKLIRITDGRTISALRNLGVEGAQGQYLAFLDADVKLSANWLEVMLTTLRRPNTVLAAAHQVNSSEAPSLERIRTALSNAVLDCAVTFLPGRNLCLSRHDFERIGGFPEHLITCEDYYFTERASRLGELYYTSEACYVHLGEDKEYTKMFRKEIWRGQSNLASIKGRTIPLREWPSFIVPIGLLILLGIASVGTIFGQWLIALWSLMLFSLPVVVYSLRLKRLVGASVPLTSVFKFYGLFFPARALGTLSGALKEVKTSSHNE